MLTTQPLSNPFIKENFMPDTYQALPGQPTSLWLATTPTTDLPTLQAGLTVDVAIVGGGIAGLTAATLLKAQGKRVAVLEADRIVEGVTGYTTAKVTSLHTLIYDYLIDHFGEEKAQAYGNANQTAIELIASLVKDKAIDCDFIRTEAYTYTDAESDLDKIRAEVKAALKLDLPAAFVQETPLPFPVKGAIRFSNQAQFHPRKYLLALARDIPGDGCYIFERTTVTDVAEGDPCVVTTEHGKLSAHAVIIASHYPFNDKTLFAPRLTPHRSYVLAVQLNEPVMRGMFITPDSAHTMRSQPTAEGDLLLVGGEGHKAGQGGDTVARYQRIEAWARENFKVQTVKYRWSTQDNGTLDRVPYVGRYTPISHNVYVATGFGGWGMTNSTAAAMILCDLIVGRENPWAELYDPNRVNLTSVPELVKQGVDVAKHFVVDRLPEATPAELEPGDGKIVRTDAGDLAMYKAEDGAITALSPACTHMGCFVQWNPAEKSWDCPCHGSRFATDGRVIQGPAIKDLEQIDVNQQGAVE
jgi:glycine/D-amino acid oxidase-like deaminating enzyme/nitrite reductase/ring-hydroxylating ferredoxin subunit